MIFKLQPISPIDRAFLPSSFDVRKVESFFNIEKKKIVLKTPVPNGNYVVKKVFDLNESQNQKMIIVHITDNTTIKRKYERATHFLHILIDFEEVNLLNGSDFNLKSDDELYVMFFSDNENINTANVENKTREERLKFIPVSYNTDNLNPDILLFKEVDSIPEVLPDSDIALEEPKESGGGVIIGGP